MAKSMRSHLRRPGLGNFGPDEHAGLGALDWPADAFQPFAEHVAAALIDGRLGLDRRVGVAQGHDGGDLDGPEHAVIVIALDRRQGADHLGVARGKTDPPAGHVVALAHRGEFDAHVDAPQARPESWASCSRRTSRRRRPGR